MPRMTRRRSAAVHDAPLAAFPAQRHVDFYEGVSVMPLTISQVAIEWWSCVRSCLTPRRRVSIS
jgi:hypothetical protein